MSRDRPGSAVRGMTEGFYGRPWTAEQRLAQVDFLGRTKQNRYLYAPGDDPYRQVLWREAYPAAERAAFRELAARARAWAGRGDVFAYFIGGAKEMNPAAAMALQEEVGGRR